MAPLPATNGSSQAPVCTTTPAASPPAPGKTTNLVKGGNLDRDIRAVEAAIAEAKLASEHYNDILYYKYTSGTISRECGGRERVVSCDFSSVDPDLHKIKEQEVKPAHTRLDNSVRTLRDDFKKELRRLLQPYWDQKNVVNFVDKAIEIAKDVINKNRDVCLVDVDFKKVPQNMLVKIASEIIVELQIESTGGKPKEVSSKDLYYDVFVDQVPQEVF